MPRTCLSQLCWSKWKDLNLKSKNLFHKPSLSQFKFVQRIENKLYFEMCSGYNTCAVHSTFATTKSKLYFHPMIFMLWSMIVIIMSTSLKIIMLTLVSYLNIDAIFIVLTGMDGY